MTLTDTDSTAAYLTARLDGAPLPLHTPAGNVQLVGGTVVLDGRLLSPVDVNGLCALLRGHAVDADHCAQRPVLAALLESGQVRELRLLPGRSPEALGDPQGQEADGLALRVGDTWYLGALLSHASGSCAWYEEVSLEGSWISAVTIYPEYTPDEARRAVEYNGAAPLLRQLLPSEAAKWDARRQRERLVRTLRAEGLFLPVPEGLLHLSLAPRSDTHRPDLRLVATTGDAHLSLVMTADQADQLALAIETGQPLRTGGLSYQPSPATLTLSGAVALWTGAESPPAAQCGEVTLRLRTPTLLAGLIR
ncbi:hypothetical protein [Deinococcus sp. RM]|uniref:hypothetical protein n=1 Tax=Deinococcus sp. RM TaxID=2316359 RepID=UPI000E690D36|nr:hypothetical protein [Deinococcus sp. RM]RIY15690.1 hypothetical protein D3W47_01300 [Deinococcus sp. RM]